MPTTATTNEPMQQGTQSHKPHGHRDQDATNTKANGQKYDTKINNRDDNFIIKT